MINENNLDSFNVQILKYQNVIYNKYDVQLQIGNTKLYCNFSNLDGLKSLFSKTNNHRNV